MFVQNSPLHGPVPPCGPGRVFSSNPHGGRGLARARSSRRSRAVARPSRGPGPSRCGCDAARARGRRVARAVPRAVPALGGAAMAEGGGAAGSASSAGRGCSASGLSGRAERTPRYTLGLLQTPRSTAGSTGGSSSGGAGPGSSSGGGLAAGGQPPVPSRGGGAAALPFPCGALPLFYPLALSAGRFQAPAQAVPQREGQQPFPQPLLFSLLSF